MQYLVNALITFALVVPAAAGFWLIYRTCGFFHFAFAASIAGGAYVLFAGLNSGVPFFAATAMSLAVSGLFGAFLDASLFRTLRHRHATALVQLVASIGIYVVAVNSLSLGFGDHPHSVRVWPTSLGFPFFSGRITGVQLVLVLAAVVVIIVTGLGLRLSNFGWRIDAVASDPELALVVGINVDSVYRSSMAFGSLLGGFSGVLASCDMDIFPSMGMQPMLMGIVAVVVGGNTLWGTVAGALLLAVARHFGVLWLPTMWQDSITFVILIVFLLVRPHGIAGRPLKKAIV